MSTQDTVTALLDILACLVMKVRLFECMKLLVEYGVDSTQTYESVKLTMEAVSRSVLILLVDTTVLVRMGFVHKQWMKVHVKVYDIFDCIATHSESI